MVNLSKRKIEETIINTNGKFLVALWWNVTLRSWSPKIGHVVFPSSSAEVATEEPTTLERIISDD